MFRLAAKITLPFVALFALVLLALGLVLAREILSEVEARVENEQRFILEVATFPGFALGEDSLRQIRDRARRAGEHGDGPAADRVSGSARSEFVVLEDGAAPLTTFDRAEPAARGVVDALQATASVEPAAASGEIQRRVEVLGGRRWLVLYTARAARGPGAMRRQFFLLYPYEEIAQAQGRALQRLLVFGGAGLLLAAGLGLLLGHWIAAPVRDLAAAARHLSTAGLNGQLTGLSAEAAPSLDLSPAAQRHDEIGELTRAFQAMVEALRASQTELLKAERLAVTGKLAATVAHEIRNPLTSLRMTVEMLQQRATGADQATREAYTVLLGEMARLSLAVEELLTYARPRPPRREPTDLNRLAEDTLKFLDRQLEHAHVRGILEPDGALPPDLQLDPNKIRQLLVNLILNAQQAIVRDGTVKVSTRWQPRVAGAEQTSRGMVVLEVADTGPGIAAEMQGRLFELFASTKGTGGLGLAIAKQIAEEHGGSIAYTTSPQGTTFTVSLPA
jgi:signal transduction histidine kinase